MSKLTAAHHKAAARKGGTPESVIKKEAAALKRRWTSPGKRSFPNGAAALASTHAYVHAYYAMNNLLPHTGRDGVDALFPSLNRNPTTWPEGDEVVVDDLSDIA